VDQLQTFTLVFGVTVSSTILPIRRKEFNTTVDPLDHLELIDVIERLGIAYHFEQEIEDSLIKINDDHDLHDLNLYHASLRFRILRQHGYNVSSGTYVHLINSHFNFGEIQMSSSNSPTKKETSRRRQTEKLFWVYTKRRTLEATEKMRGIRIESRFFLSYYEQDSSHNASLLRFANVGVYYEPRFSMYTKAFIILTILDDICDSYGTLEELTKFTEAIARWYLQEAEWRELKYVPTYEEYFENGIRSIACATMVIVSFLDNQLDESVANNAFESLDKQRDHVAGAVDCYMKQYGVSEEEAYVAIKTAIENAWKDLNEEIYINGSTSDSNLFPQIFTNKLTERIQNNKTLKSSETNKNKNELKKKLADTITSKNMKIPHHINLTFALMVSDRKLSEVED
ncbi:hypothetical protein V2J09_014667, partial [Rumex salicifolius]